MFDPSESGYLVEVHKRFELASEYTFPNVSETATETDFPDFPGSPVQD